jgi:hypothetical protein
VSCWSIFQGQSIYSSQVHKDRHVQHILHEFELGEPIHPNPYNFSDATAASHAQTWKAIVRKLSPERNEREQYAALYDV